MFTLMAHSNHNCFIQFFFIYSYVYLFIYNCFIYIFVYLYRLIFIYSFICFLGAPVGTSLAKWEAVRKVVAGRLVNCYAWNDWILALLYRSKSYEIGVAGLYHIFLNSSSNNNNKPRSNSPLSPLSPSAHPNQGVFS